jgi:S1-C subfamily serine protease
MDLPMPDWAYRAERGTVMVLNQSPTRMGGRGAAVLVATKADGKHTLGLFLTNKHVVDALRAGPNGMTVSSGRVYSIHGNVVNRGGPFAWESTARDFLDDDEAADLAAFTARLPNDKNIMPVELEDWSGQAGEEVLAIGSPDVSLRRTWTTQAPDHFLVQQLWSKGVTRGFRSEHVVPRLTHTADLLKGSSGGPVINARGNVIGLNVRRISTTEIQYNYLEAVTVGEAISAGEMRTFIQRLVKKGRW